MKTPTSSSRRQFLKSALLTAGSVPLAQQLLAAAPAAGRQPSGPGDFRLSGLMQVVCSPPDSAPARTAGVVLARQLALRGVKTTAGGSGSHAVELRCEARLKRDEYEVDSNEKRTTLCASTVSGFLAACGEWLRSLDWSDNPPLARTFTRKHSPAVELRMQQIPGHFGNSFECLSRLEMAAYLTDQALAGSNGYADRYDVGEFVDPFHHHANRQSKPLSYAAELWAKKARHLLDARQLGMATCVTLNPNHVYLDQWSPALDATPGPHMVGNLICPSKPEARRFILRNYRDLFGYLHETGVTLDAIRPAPYDDGGCACAKCKPWLLTFLGLAEEISAIGREHWPAMETFMSGWWLNDADIETLRQWKASHQADWLTTFLFSTGYTITKMPDLRRQLNPIRYGTYVHAGYSDRMGGDDRYGRTGTHSAPRRLQNLFRQYPAVGCLRFMAYTEGLESHLNSFLTARLGYDPEGDTATEIAGYCRWYFGTSESDTTALVGILMELESLEGARARQWHQQLLALAPRIRALPGRQYLWDQLVIKTELMSLDYRAKVLLKGKNLKTLNRWPAAIATIAQAYEERYDHLQRKVWGTGVRRHVLQDSYYVPAWLNQYWQTRHADRRPLLRRESGGKAVKIDPKKM